MNKKRIIASVTAAAAISMLVGCGGSSSSSNDVKVVDGLVINAEVFDANGQVAMEKDSVSYPGVYTFDSAPALPITSTGGCIDIDANGVCDAGEKVAPDMKSFEKNIVTVLTNEIVKLAGDDINNKATAETTFLANLGLDGVSMGDVLSVNTDGSYTKDELNIANYVIQTSSYNSANSNISASSEYASILAIYESLKSDNANATVSDLESKLLSEGIAGDAISQDQIDFNNAKAKIEAYANQDSDNLAIYNNIGSDDWTVLANEKYSENGWKMYKSPIELNCETNFNGTNCEEPTYTSTATLLTNILFAYNANSTQETNSNTTSY